MKFRYPIACCIALLLLGAEPTTGPSTIPHTKVGESIIIIGDLGVPVGEQVTITGIKKFDRGGQSGFVVETIDGKTAPASLPDHGERHCEVG
jgi:hypothetical protein